MVADAALVYRAFPLARNKILVRFENIADRFDGKMAAETRYIDMQSFATQFLQDANKGVKTNILGVSIDEVSLSNNKL